MKLFAPLLALAALGAIVALARSGIDVAKLAPARGSVTYTDRTGIVLGTILSGDSTHAIGVRLEAVSPDFREAIVAAEDARFWQHGGVDLFALLRAAREYAIFGEARSGGSTIEMQLARLIYPSRHAGGALAQMKDKLAQIATAERIEIGSSKAAVLEAYINRAPMGGNLYGVEAAARTYFGEPASDLDLAQASLLAAIPNDPSRLAPYSNWRALRKRQRYVLDRMVALGEVDRPTADRALAEMLDVRRHDSGIADAPHALFYLYRGGVEAGGRERTTLDRSLQRFVQAQTQDVIDALARYHVTDAAALVADNRTGDVLAYVGSPDYFSDAALGRNDGVQALRQAGSSLKPFTYELALERETIRSTTILPDVPAAYAIPGGRLYQPADYSGRFSGPVRVRYALANSLNVPAVRVLSDLGVPKLLDRLHELGFAHLDHPASYYGLGLTLGSGEVSLWELVQAYVTMAREGDFLALHLAGESGAGRQVGEAPVWELVTDILADPHARSHSFGLHSVLEMPFPAAVKTGTSSDFHDTWTVGFTRDYTVGVWVGNFDGSAMRGVSGVTGAGPLWNRIMLHLYERNAEPPPFTSPRGYVRVAICATTGRAPSRTQPCPAIVKEWVRPEDLASLRPTDERTTLRIAFPHEGDTFVLNDASNALQQRSQQIALRAMGSGTATTIRWSVDGTPLAFDANGDAFWPLRLGAWRIEATDGEHRAGVTIRVVPPPRPVTGFTR
ncbi:MAG TPA: penicillin-binding protein 1C [Candidatus Cybelea sp.]|jgi:penicillin-binding protein 1C|nr:penicillin-binding protein 1C [Candidatus Cybelea sp.]